MDLELIETGGGGDLLKKGNDLSMIFGFENMPYLALFGGNVESSTPSKRVANEQDFSWWGNALLFPNTPETQFNSLTERTLHQVALTSAGRLVIEDAIKKDLEFMRPFAIVKVDTAIIATDHIRIAITIQQPDNLEAKEFIFLWDSTRAELTGASYRPNPVVTHPEFLEYELQFYL